MAVVEEDFEGAAPGTAMSTTNTIFTGFGTAGTKTLEAGGVNGQRGLFDMATGTDTAYAVKAVASSAALQARWYVKVSTIAHTSVYRLLTAVLVNTAKSRVQISTTDKFVVQNGTTTVGTSAMSVVADTWYRLELEIDSAGGTQELRIFTGANLHGATPDETLAGAYTTSDFDELNVGSISAIGIAGQVSVDDFAYDLAAGAGPIGPAVRVPGSRRHRRVPVSRAAVY